MHQNLLPNNNDAQSTTKYGFLLRPGAQIVALRAHCTRTALKALPILVVLVTTICKQNMAKGIRKKKSYCSNMGAQIHDLPDCTMLGLVVPYTWQNMATDINST